MDEMKVKLADAVAAKLAAAPQSAAKDELLEELSDNLYRRFLDMTGAGMSEEEAFGRALDDLGDVDELLRYLGVEPGGDVTIDQKEGQTRITTRSGKTVVINNPGGEPINTNCGSAGKSGAPQEETGTAFEGDIRYGYQPKDSTDGQGGARDGSQPPQSDLDAILAGVSEACNTAIDQAKAALKQAKEALRQRTTWEKDNGHVRVHFNTRPDGQTPPESPDASQPSAPPSGDGWEFEAELNSDEGRFFAGAGPKQRKDVVYGFGYDKTKGGFFAQWGEYQGEHPDGSQQAQGPYFSGADASMEAKDDGSYSVTALRDLRGIEVHTNAGDVSIHVSEAPDAGVIIDGDVDDLDVTCSADGVLTIREGRTASSSFFSRRGIGSADVELFLPCRFWEMISVTTASGDVDIDREGLDIGQLTVSTASGDLSARLKACRTLRFKSASGDLDLKGTFANLHAETMSGDISIRGQADEAVLKSASGDIEMEGPAGRFHGVTMSGDVSLETSVLPQVMELSSKSGDCQARLPDAGPFSVRMKTVSGEMGCDFPVSYVNGAAVYGDGSGPAYSITSISGDVSLERY